MLGYYVDVGYFPGNDPRLVKKLSDIVFTDIGKPLTFATASLDSSIPVGTTSTFEFSTDEETVSFMESKMGQDYSVIYSLPSRMINQSVNNYIKYWNQSIYLCPSLPKSFESYYNKLVNGELPGVQMPAYYFKSLNKVIVGWGNYSESIGSAGNLNLYNVVDDAGNLSMIASNSSPLFPDWGRGPYGTVSIHNYENGWENAEIYGIGNVDIGNTYITTRNVSISRWDPSNKDLSILKTLLGSEIKPDFTIDPSIPPDNPYEPGGDSGEGGGGGNFDDDSDPIPDSTLPTLSSSNTGFTRIYNPSLSQVQSLAKYLWTDDSVIETIWNHIKQYFENPMEAIIGFNLVPVSVPDGGTQNFALMYIDTGVSMTVAANQFVDVDCGTLDIQPYYGSALDYSPYTKISCFLPFIGTVQLNVDEVMNTTLTVRYRVDICSGSCVAKILVNGNVLYQYSGHCAIPIPIAAADFSSYVSAAISVAKLAIGAAVGGGMGALMAGNQDPVQQTNQVVTRTTTTTETARNPSTGRQITTGTRSTVETVERPQDTSSTQASFDGLSPTNITNTVGQIMSSKPHVEHSGSFSGNTGYLGVRRPYIIIQRPNMCMPSQYQQFNGFPCMITLTLGDCSGFTQVQQVQLTGMTATNPEQAEILTFLKSGVIL